jgi:hypothetical protein
VESRIGGRHTAWDGYIEGEILELEPSRRILQSWRSLDFPADSPPSRLELLFNATSDGGVEMTLLHSEIPEGQGTDYEEGWFEYYLKPMQRYFRGESPLVPEPAQQHAPVKKKAAPVKAKAKQAASKKTAPAKKKAAPAKKAKKAAPAKKAKKPKKAVKKAVPKKKAAPTKKKGKKR